jgi:hypothetical protein
MAFRKNVTTGANAAVRSHRAKHITSEQFAAATRAASRARFEQELLAGREDIQEHVLAQAKRQRAAAETRCARLVRAIDALESRLEND